MDSSVSKVLAFQILGPEFDKKQGTLVHTIVKKQNSKENI